MNLLMFLHAREESGSIHKRAHAHNEPAENHLLGDLQRNLVACERLKMVDRDQQIGKRWVVRLDGLWVHIDEGRDLNRLRNLLCFARTRMCSCKQMVPQVLSG